ncbi:hypothetical protein BELL_2618g00010 [Botrytis elliptica]|uniref:Uncharacterized protein n=1 Tax=Botrytis elliptica TaxID=278938 RepID=A0A4Z1H5K1_9HELO|nr:hypothetical protein BELL_2618g00010 [Botrytis elliptica]
MDASSKTELEAMSESVSHELGQFYVNNLIIEPVPSRTAILGNTNASRSELGPGYK